MAIQANFSPGGKKPDLEINKPAASGKFWQNPWFIFALYLVMLYVFLFAWPEQGQKTEEIPYNRFLQELEQNKIRSVVIYDSKYIKGEYREDDPAGRPKTFVTVPLDDLALAEKFKQHGVDVKVRKGDNWVALFFMNWVLPIALITLFWFWLSRRMTGGGKGFLNLGPGKVHIHPDTGPKVTFDDVAGVDEAKQELQEVIAFLRDPEKIQSLGGRMPKGVLLVGPPGTGKTLLGKAVSGEAEVPFFYISGSEFIEMFVGVGAARVRDLFDQARKNAPCIIFIDELDAVGRSRGIAPGGGGNEEREQTLNQLLVEMDGFDPSIGVVVMAATNRPELLDKALLRAGRFDRQIVVDKPDLEERVAILKIHVRRLKLGDDVDLQVIAQRTPGMVGADLANICNEAAIIAVRNGHAAVQMSDFEAAIDRVLTGPEKKHRAMSAEEKRRVAFHESGHTLVAETVPTAEPVHKVSIIPRGVAALGYTLQLPVKEKFLSTEEELKDQLAILLGGRVAEELVFGVVSSGAANDLERATEIARSMVTQLGMSPRLGPLTWGRIHRALYLETEAQEERNYSETIAEQIDAEVKALIEEAHRRATTILEQRRRTLDALAARLEEKEVISGEEVQAVIRDVEGEPA